VARDPENLTRKFHKVDRRGRLLVDTDHNHYSATFALLSGLPLPRKTFAPNGPLMAQYSIDF
jgi:hypothetical protein